MSLEQTLERIAVALEESNRIRLAEMANKVKPIADAVEQALEEAKVTYEPEAEAEPEAEEKELELDRSELLVKCGKLGIVVPHGTRTTTLVKWIAKAEAEKEAEPIDDDASDELSHVTENDKEEEPKEEEDGVLFPDMTEDNARPKTGAEVIDWFKKSFGYSADEIADFKKAFEPEKHLDESGNRIPFAKLPEADLLEVFDKYYALRGSEKKNA